MLGKIVKGVKNIAKASFKVKIVLSIKSLTLSTNETVYIKPLIKRGDQQAQEMMQIKIQSQEMSQHTLPNSHYFTVEISETTITITDNAPQPKLCLIKLISTDSQGNDTAVIAEKQINLAMHFGTDFAQQIYQLD